MNAINIFPSTPQPVGAVYEAANECPAGISPPDIGGVAAPSRKRCEATAAAQTGWSGMTKCFRMRSFEEVPFSTTPAAPLKEASRLLLDVASPPPMSGGEWGAPQFIHTFYDRAGFVVQSPSPLRRGVCAMRRMLRSLHCAAACILLLGTSALAATQ